MSIRELLDDIQKLNIVMPEFQREYVWHREQAKQLLVSLYKEYPTGSLLFWKTDNPPDIKNSAVARDKVGTTNVILDGQQRLTTLYLLTRGEIPPYYRESEILNDPRSLYFNLEDGEFQYYQSQRMERNPTWVPVVDAFTKPDSINPFVVAQERAGEGADAFQLAQRFNGTLTRLRNILERPYPIQTVPPTADIDDAIDVFDRVNSLGTKLTDSELALAHITGKWPHARRVMKEKISELAERRFAFDLGFMVRALTGVIHTRALVEVIHGTQRPELEDGWKRLSKILDYVVSVLPGHAAIHSTEDLNTNNVLIPVIVHLAHRGGKFGSIKDIKRCVHWLYAASAWARYSGQTDQRLDHDVSVVGRSPDPWAELVNAIIDQRGRIQVKEADFEGRSVQHPLYRMAYIAIKRNAAEDWFNGALLAEPVGKAYQLHSHHIFPASLLYSAEGGYTPENHLQKQIVNEIANRAFLTGDSNISLGNTEPAEYFPQVEAQFPGALAKQFVPMDPDLWKVERYEAFLQARRRLLAAAINRLMEGLVSEEGEQPEPRLTLEQLIEAGESQVVEFKSSLRWDVRQQQVNKGLEKVVAKTVAGFLNAEGGTLVIGVADDGTVLGIQPDMDSTGRSDRDGYEQKLIQVLEGHLGTAMLQNLRIRFDTYDGRTACIVDVDASPQPAFLKDGTGREFYARIGNTTRSFDLQGAHEYISMHWQA